MEQTIVVSLAWMKDRHKERIEQTAAAHGWKALFFDSNEEALPAMEQAQIGYGLGADLTRAGKNLKWFHSMSAGVDAYLVPGAIANEEMTLTNSSGAYGVALAEHALMTALEVLRREPEYERAMAERKWLRRLRQLTLKGRRVTVLGTGDIGQEIAKRCAAFEPVRITGVNRRGKSGCPHFDEIVTQDAADEVLSRTDLLFMCLPGTPETYRFMDVRRIALLPRDAVLVNVGRGNAVDQTALADALKDGRLFGAALDVFDVEPLPADSPLWDCPRLLITPHVAGDLTAAYTLDKNVSLFAENLERYLERKPLAHVVDRKAGY